MQSRRVAWPPMTPEAIPNLGAARRRRGGSRAERRDQLRLGPAPSRLGLRLRERRVDRRALAIMTVPLTRGRVIVDLSADDEEGERPPADRKPRRFRCARAAERVGSRIAGTIRVSPTLIFGSYGQHVGTFGKAHRRVTARRCGVRHNHLRVHATCLRRVP